MSFKISILVLFTIFQDAVSENCMEGFVEYDNLCLKLTFEAKSLPDATEECYKSHGRIPTYLPTDAGKQVVESSIGSGYDYVFLGGKYDKGRRCYDFDGKVCLMDEEFEFWIKGEPKQKENYPCIVMFKNENYLAVSWTCTQKNSAVCTKDESDNCTQPGFVKVLNLCFKILEIGDTAEGHKQSCREIQSTLGIAKTRSDWQVLGQAILLKPGPGPLGFLGGAKKETEGWLDSRGHQVPSDVWLSGHPNEKFGNCSVMVPDMNNRYLKLQTAPCDIKTGYICEYADDATTTTGTCLTSPE